LFYFIFIAVVQSALVTDHCC